MNIPIKHSYFWLALLFFLAFVAEQHWLHVLTPLEHAVSDRMQARYSHAQQADPDIVIVDIDEKSLVAMADSVGRWPWPRSMHAELLEAIVRQHPTAIVFDVLFSDPDLARPEDDAYFSQTIGVHANLLYFPMMLLNASEQGKGIPLAEFGERLGVHPEPGADASATASLVLPLPAMLKTGHVGSNNPLPDSDGTVRSYPVYINISGWHLPSLPAKVIGDQKGMKSVHALIADADEMRKAKTFSNGSILLNWHGGAFAYRHISYADIYQDMQRSQPQRSPQEFTNKIVIIGSTASGLFDIRKTPVNAEYPGVEILATAIDNMKNGDVLKPVPSIINLFLIMIMLGLMAALLQKGRHLLAVGFGLLLVLASLIFLSYQLLALQRMYWVASLVLFTGTYYLLVGMLEYLQHRKKLGLAMQTFGRFLDPRVVKALIEQGQTMASLSGKSQALTILFSDIRGFTTLSETSAPEQVVALLNAYFELQSGAVFQQEGTLDKYIGDAIMAFWGAPIAQPDHAVRAVAAALEMSDRLERFKAEAAMGYDIEIGIGIHTGRAVVGFIGSEARQDYTAIGDAVNLASRIEGLTKGIARILVSEDTKQACEQIADCPFLFRDCGSHVVKGRAQAVQLYEPMRKHGK